MSVCCSISRPPADPDRSGRAAPRDLPAAFGHEFHDPSLLRQALTHRSHGRPNNERLEFVGDAVLNCAIAHALYQRLPDAPEGDLSRLRANLVNQGALAALARDLGLGDRLDLGEGELRSGGADRPSILADALEAVIGAIFLDAGYVAAAAYVERTFANALAATASADAGKDPKTALQELLQGRRLGLPEYRVVRVQGEAHRQEFEVECRVATLGIVTEGHGTSRRHAEQNAARVALDKLPSAAT